MTELPTGNMTNESQAAESTAGPAHQHVPPSPKVTPTEQVLSHRDGYRQICGADLSRPIFDGKSTNPADHFIDLDTPSMETALDVRLYFWLLGNRLRKTVNPFNHTLEQAKFYDDEVVREGRLYLKACRDRGHGYFLNPTRHLAWFEKPGNPWYRMPTLGVVNDLAESGLLGEPGEGFFETFKGESYAEEEQMEIYCCMATNIRIPLLWADFESEEFRQGSASWNTIIISMYSTLNPIARLLWEYGRDGFMDRIFFRFDCFTDRAGRDAYFAREWPSEVPDSSDDDCS